MLLAGITSPLFAEHRRQNIMASKKHSVLFICLGNICRSQIAEAVFRHLVDKKGVTSSWDIDSGAIGTWHIGKTAYDKTHKCLQKNGLKTTHIVRQVNKNDFTKYDVIFGMDEENMSDLEGIKPKNSTAKLQMLGEFDPEKELIIVDPYYPDTTEAFDKVFEQCMRCCAAYLDANP